MVRVNYGLNEVLEDRLEEQILESISFRVDMESFSEEKYQKKALKACMDYIDDSLVEGKSLKSISRKIELRDPEDAEITAENTDIDIDSGELAEVYKQAYDEAAVNVDKVERTDHEKAIHYLIEHSIETNNFEKDYDAVFSETFFSDQSYQNKSQQYPEIKMNKHRELDEIIASDADFWRVNLENEEINLVEVKTSDKEVKNRDKDVEELDPDFRHEINTDTESRRDRQIEDFKEAVNYANGQAGTNFDVNKEVVIARDMLDPEDEPGFYIGDYRLAEGVETENLEKLESFVDELLFDMGIEEADQIDDVSPEQWVEKV